MTALGARREASVEQLLWVLPFGLALIAIVVVGYVTFTRSGAAQRSFSNRMMRLRVAVQLIAVIVLLAILAAFGAGGE